MTGTDELDEFERGFAADVAMVTPKPRTAIAPPRAEPNGAEYEAPPAEVMVSGDDRDDLPPVMSASDFGLDEEAAAPDDRPRLVLTLPEFLARYQPPDYLVDGILQHHRLYSLTGMTGAGKTAVGLLVAILVGTRGGGQKLGPHEVEPGRVLYIARENPEDVRARLIGMTSRLDIDPAELNVLPIEELQNLEADLPRITEEVKAFGDVALVIVDTSAAVFIGDAENDNVQMLEHARRLRRLCSLPGRPCVLALCHPVKNASTHESLLPRGGGAFLNEVDGNLTLLAHDERLSDMHWTGKFRGPDFEKITFRIETARVPELLDRKNRLLPFAMASVVTDHEAAEAEAKTLFQDDKLLIAMFARPRGSLAEWASDCGWFLHGDHSKPNKALAQRVTERLKADKLVEKQGRQIVLTKPGKAAAQKAKNPHVDDEANT